MSLFNSNLSSIFFQKSSLKLEPLLISKNQKDKLNSSHQLISERLNQSKIIYTINNKLDHNNKQRKLFYSPQSRKLPKINLTDSQLNKENKILGVTSRQVDQFSNNSGKICSVDRQQLIQRNEEKLIENIEFVQNNKEQVKQDFQDNSIDNSVSLMQSLQVQEQTSNEIEQKTKYNSKIKIKTQVKEPQQLTSLQEIPFKTTKNQSNFSPKRQQNKNIQLVNNHLNEKKNESQKEGILQAYRYDKELISLCDDFVNSHVLKNKHRQQNDQNINMIMKYKQLQKLYENQMKYFDKLCQHNQEGDQKDQIHTKNFKNQEQFGEYQEILDRLEFTNVNNQNDNIEMTIYEFEITLFIQLLETLVEGCSFAIKEQLLFLQSIFHRIIYANTNSKVINQLSCILQKQQTFHKQMFYAKALFLLLDHIEKKQQDKVSLQQEEKDYKQKAEEKIKVLQEYIEELQKKVDEFNQKEKEQEDKFKQKQIILLDLIEQKDHFLENDVKKEMQVLQMQIDQSENQHRLVILQYQNTLMQKIQEIRELKELNNSQQKKFSQLEQEYHSVLQNQAQSIKWMIKNSENADKLHQKLNQYKDMIQSVNQKHQTVIQDFTPRPSFKKIDQLLESNKSLVYTNNKPAKKQQDSKSNEIKVNTILSIPNNSNSEEQQNSEQKIKDEKMSTQSKIDEINDFITQILQKFKKQQQQIDIRQNKTPRVQKQHK